MSIQQYEQNAKDKVTNTVASWNLRRKFFILLGILLLLVVIYGLFAANYVYSDGNRAGIVRKISHKGFVMKTWEGEMQTGISLGGQIGGGDLWQFTSENNPDLIAALDKAAQSGKRVSLHYREKPYQFSFLGDTRYFVDKVEEVPQ